MSTEVEICNLALSRLGDTATVSSIDPPEGSAQAEHCARFYPHERDALLEAHQWTFNTKRAQLAEIESQSTSWEYAYSLPSDYLKAWNVIPPNTSDDNIEAVSGIYTYDYSSSHSHVYTDQVSVPFVIELLEDDSRVLYTDQCDAILRYSAKVTDTAKFSPMFVKALSYQLASSLAGPLIKGDRGEATGQRMVAMAVAVMNAAATSDANQRKVELTHVPAHMNRR